MTELLDFLSHLDDSGSSERARDSEVEIASVVPGGPFIVGFEDGDDVHEVTLYCDADDWHGDCWALHDDGTQHERCKGLTYSDGPCAHLFAVRQAVARGEVDVLDAAEERADQHAEEIVADGGRR